MTGMLLFPMKAGSAFLTDFPSILAPVATRTQGSPVDNVLTYSALPAGYYGVKFPFSATAGSASYQSRPYGCPVTKAFDTASRGAFDSCSGTMVSTAPSSEPGMSSMILIIVIVVCVLTFVAIMVIVIVVVVRKRRDKVSVSEGMNFSINGEENVSATISQDSSSSQEIAAKKEASPRKTKKWLTRNLPPIDYF